MEVMRGHAQNDTAEHLLSEKSYKDMGGVATKGVEPVSNVDDIDPKPTLCGNGGSRGVVELKTCDLDINSALQNFVDDGREDAEPRVDNRHSYPAVTPCGNDVNEEKPVSGGWYDSSEISECHEEVRDKAEPKADNENVNTYLTPCSVEEKGDTASGSGDAYLNALLNLCGKRERDEGASRQGVSVNTTRKQPSIQKGLSEMPPSQLACQERLSHADVLNPSRKSLDNSDSEHLFREITSVARGSPSVSADFNDDSVRILDNSQLEVTDTNSERDAMGARNSLNTGNSDVPLGQDWVSPQGSSQLLKSRLTEALLCGEGKHMKAEPEADDEDKNAYLTPYLRSSPRCTELSSNVAVFNSLLDFYAKKEQDEATSRHDDGSVNTTPKQSSNQGEPSGMLAPDQERSSHANVSSLSYNSLDRSEKNHLFRDAMSIIHGSQSHISADSKTGSSNLGYNEIFRHFKKKLMERSRQNDDSVSTMDTSVLEVTDTNSETDTISAGNSLKTGNSDVTTNSDSRTTFEPVQQSQGSNTLPKSRLTEAQLLEVWELAKKLYEARVAINQSVCRQQLPPENTRRRGRRKSTALSGRGRPGKTCKIGVGYNWKDPPEWQWGDPIPEEIRTFLPTLGSEAPAVICLSDDESYAGSSTKVSRSDTKTAFGGSDNSITISDSEDELPDISEVLLSAGTTGTKPEPSSIDPAGPQEVIPVGSKTSSVCPVHGGLSVTVCSVTVPPMPLNRGPKRRRLMQSTDVKKDVIVLSSSDESDTEIELVQIARKRQQDRAPEPPPEPPLVSEPAEQPSCGSELKTSWSCPICLEAKEDVESVVSTKCGHVFCGPCIESSLKVVKQCPTCRRKLTVRQVHKIFI